jgi:hypothetical protein
LIRLRLVAQLLLTLISFAVPAVVGPGAAASTREHPTAPQWQGPLLEGPVRKLIAFADGTLLARRPEDVQQSVDGGQTWSDVPLPPGGSSPSVQFVGADPNDESVLFATGAAPLYKSTDGGATWRPLLTDDQLDALKRDSEVSGEVVAEGYGFRALAVVVSPTDRGRVYAEFAWSYGGSPEYPPYGLYSSSDAGETWTLLQKVAYGTLCHVRVLLLLPHPTNPKRLFRDTDCLAGRNFGSSLEQSMVGGRTLLPFWDESAGPQAASRIALPSPTISARRETVLLGIRSSRMQRRRCHHRVEPT